ncbi:MAG: hypothetical protein QOD14_526 [Solirubrobacterales bacterium]|nr:hypothetical protein [Solirubrobacterales bacterium]
MTRSRVRSVISALVVAAGLLAVFAQPAAASPGAFKVLFLNGVEGSCLGDTGVQDQLAAMPGVAKVDAFDANAGTPSVAMLDQYDLAVAHSDCNAYSDPTAIGNNLADYADHGGVVVEYAYSMHSSPGFQLAGRWLSGGYSPYGPGTNVNNNVTLGTFDASSPLMAGVNNLASDCNTAATLASGATRVAQWNNGQEAVALKGHAIAVNASVDDSSCTWSGDYARLTLNAVTLLTPPYGTVISKKTIVKKKHKAKFEFSASGHVTGFECALGRSKKGKKKPKLSFGSCSSPKSYKHLKPGRYTFEVRALNSNGPDSNPATKKFRI